MTGDSSALRELIAKYAELNAARALGNQRPSEFRIHRFGNVFATVDPARPGSPMCNRVLGFCEAAIPDIESVLAVYDDAGEQAHFDIAAEDQSPAVVESLTHHGFGAAEALDYLGFCVPRAKPNLSRGPVEVNRWEPGRADAFLDLLKSSGVACEPRTWRDRRRFYCTDAFRTFVASCDGRPCAWATLFVAGNSGYLANAYTQQGFRRRGCHTALLQARIEDAIELGVRWLITDVVAGSQSHENCKRAGFRRQTVLTLWEEGPN